MKFWIVAAVFSLTLPAMAQQASERLLVPIASADTPGALGSLWRSEIWVRNLSNEAGFAGPVIQSHFTLGPGVTYELPIYKSPPFDPPGKFLFVSGNIADKVAISLRVSDVNSRAVNEGTEIPVVREREFRAGRVVLINVPANSLSRTTLRIYQSNPETSGAVLVKVYPNQGNDLLGSVELPLIPREPLIFFPAYTQIMSISGSFPAVSGHAKIRIEIEPVTDGPRIWAFTSTTNNLTQNVTVVSPY